MQLEDEEILNFVMILHVHLHDKINCNGGGGNGNGGGSDRGSVSGIVSGRFASLYPSVPQGMHPQHGGGGGCMLLVEMEMVVMWEPIMVEAVKTKMEVA